MARIKIEDLPVLEELSEKEVKGIFGGLSCTPPENTPPIDEISRRDPVPQNLAHDDASLARDTEQGPWGGK